MENQTLVKEPVKGIKRRYHTVVSVDNNTYERKEFRSRKEVVKYLSDFDPRQIVLVFRGKCLDVEFKRMCSLK